jgi:prophage antirepressor-like protein
MKDTNSLKVVGTISFGNHILDVYGDLDEPLFKATDISNMLGYSSGNTWNMLNMCEEDEKLKLPMVVAGQSRMINFVTENGLYNILSQTRTELSRGWRRVVHNELINLRKASGKDIIQKFDEWSHELDNIYFDEETGILMQSVTVQGGDVIQVPLKEVSKND